LKKLSCASIFRCRMARRQLDAGNVDQVISLSIAASTLLAGRQQIAKDRSAAHTSPTELK
jgi:hypothetical protein